MMKSVRGAKAGLGAAAGLGLFLAVLLLAPGCAVRDLIHDMQETAPHSTHESKK